MTKNLWIIMAFVSIAVGAFFVTRQFKNFENRPPGSTDVLQKFSVVDYVGNVIQSEDLVGTPLVLNAWATWCPFCIKELPDFVAAQSEFGDLVKIIAINRQESPDRSKRFINELGLDDQLIFLLDPDDNFYRSIGGYVMPETVFIDAGGKIIFRKRGPMQIEEIRQKIESIL